MSEPDNPLRRRLLKDLMGYAVSSYLGVVTQPFGFLLKGGAPPTPTEDLATQKSLELLRTRLADKMGISQYRVDESHVGELLANLRTAIKQEEANIRIPRAELAGLVAAYVGAKIHKEKGLYITDVQFSKEVKGMAFDVVAHVSFGMLCIRLQTDPATESEISDFSRLCVAPNVEEGWLVAPRMENKTLRGAPMILWENRYLIPIVRITNYEAIFDELLSPIVASFKSGVKIEGQTLVLHLSQKEMRKNPKVGRGPRSSQGSIVGLGADERDLSAK